MINKAVEIVCSGIRKEYHILVIITDGQVTETDQDETARSIVNASNYPLSIIVIGGNQNTLYFKLTIYIYIKLEMDLGMKWKLMMMNYLKEDLIMFDLLILKF